VTIRAGIVDEILLTLGDEGAASGGADPRRVRVAAKSRRARRGR
jgi:hypothetical protein